MVLSDQPYSYKKHSLYSMLKKMNLRAKLHPVLLDLIRHSQKAGKEVVTAESYADIEPLICPTDSGIFSVEFTNTLNRKFTEAVITEATFGKKTVGRVFGTRFIPENLKKRPNHSKAFVWGKKRPTCKEFDSCESAFQVPFDSALYAGIGWLGGNINPEDTLVVAFKAGGEVNLGTGIYIVPKNAAWLVGLLSRLVDIVPLEQVPNPDMIIVNAPGIREEIFDDVACSIINAPEAEGEPFIALVNNTYPGGGAKKTMLTILQAKAVMSGKRIVHHASIVEFNQDGKKVRMVYSADSGGGKTEWTLNLPQVKELEVSKWHNGNFVMHYEDEFSMSRQVAGDDMVVMLPGGISANVELGAFNRVNGSAKAGDLPMEDGILSAAQRFIDEDNSRNMNSDIFCVNMLVTPSKTLHTWNHEEDANGNRNTNPRITYRNEMVPGYVWQPGFTDWFVFGVSNVQSAEANGYQGLPHGALHVLTKASAFINYLVAPRKAASVSVFGQDKTVLTSRRWGSMEDFCITGDWKTTKAAFLEFCTYPDITQYALTTVGHIGEREVGYTVEQLVCEVLAKSTMGRATWDLQTPSDLLLGQIARSIKVGNNFFASGLEHPATQGEIGISGYKVMAQNARKIFEPAIKEILVRSKEDESPEAKLCRKVLRLALDVPSTKTAKVNLLDRYTSLSVEMTALGKTL